MGTTASRNIYQLKVTLAGSRPPIWRRVLVPGDMVLGQLHLVLQIAMGWTDSHLHQFVCNRICYGIRDDEFGIDMDVEDENDYRLNQLLTSEKDTMIYEYDFGDGWEHKMVLEKVLPFDRNKKLPLCIKGKRACPPEDCGGVWGYQELIETLKDPKHPEYEEMLEWVGEDFDPEAFDIDEVNELLAEYVR